MKEKITAFINELITYDYILFGSSFALFIIFIILALILRKKIGLAIFLVLLSFTILLIGPTVGYMEMHKYLFKNSTTLISEKKLQFSDAIVVKGSIKNESELDFKSCKITVNIHKVSKNIIRKHLYKLKPMRKMHFIETDISIGNSKEFKVIVEPFTYSKEYNITLGAKCK
ncbi:MAG: DUF2393 domain-containing protein [Campylobacterota bacterium]|nr:DUF2393 domain-containing protein [Campylobacterota bacterium]